MKRFAGLIVAFVSIWADAALLLNVAWFRRLPLMLGFPTLVMALAFCSIGFLVGFAAIWGWFDEEEEEPK